MTESNYDILRIRDGASRAEIRDAFRKLALEHHSDRGGDDEEFKKIKQAFDDLKIGKKYPDSKEETQKKSKFYSGDSEEEKLRRNLILSRDVANEIKTPRRCNSPVLTLGDIHSGPLQEAPVPIVKPTRRRRDGGDSGG